MRNWTILLVGFMTVAAPSRTVEFIRGTAEPEAMVAYVARLPDGIAAVDLRTGKELWRAPSQARPLAVFADRLVLLGPADARGTATVMLAARDSSLTPSASWAVPLPPRTLPQDSQFVSRAGIDGSTLSFAYSYQPSKLLGFPAQPGGPISKDATKPESFTIDLASKGPAVAQSEDATSLSPRSAAYSRSGRVSQEAWVAGDASLWLGSDARQGGQLRLNRQASSQDAVASVPLPVSARDAEVLVSEDGRFVCVRDASAGGTRATVLAASSLQRIGTLLMPLHVTAVAILGNHGYWLATQPTGADDEDAIVAADIDADRTLWSYSLGKRPPSRRPVR